MKEIVFKMKVLDNAKLEQNLEAIRQGKIAVIDMPHIIDYFGPAYFFPAIPTLAQLLTHDEALVRDMALKILTLYFRLPEYWCTAREFMEHDPEEICRDRGATSLGWLQENTKDVRTLCVLARVIRNDHEEESVRERAYQSMRAVFNYNVQEQNRLVDEELNFDTGVDWEFVDTYIRLGEPELRVELEQKRQRLRRGHVPPNKIMDILLDFGRAQYLEAQPDIEGYLSNEDPFIRARALEVLTDYLHLRSYWETARRFLEQDPATLCRVQGADAFGIIERNTQDRRTLTLLAKVVRNEQAEYVVRRATYRAMRNIVDYDPEEQYGLTDDLFNFSYNVDWNFVDSYLES
jgi:hypothetical protein